VNDRRPYGDDPYRRHGEPSTYGRPSAPGQQQPPSVPNPRPGGAPYGAPGRPQPPRQAQPTHDAPAQRPQQPSGPARRGGNWEDDENTQMIGKLGFVPPEARSMNPEDDRFNLDRLHDNNTKVRARKRAKKASPLAKVGGVVAVVAVVALLGGGVWWLTSGEDPADESGLAYEVLDAPCDALDTTPLEDLSAGSNELPPLEESREIGSKTEQKCAISLSAEAGTGVDVEVSSTVFSRDAGAKNEFRDAAEEAEEAATDTRVYAEVDGPGTDAFTVARTWQTDTGSADFSLYLYDANAYLHVRVTIYSVDEVSDSEVAAHATEVATTYLDNWRG